MILNIHNIPPKKSLDLQKSSVLTEVPRCFGAVAAAGDPRKNQRGGCRGGSPFLLPSGYVKIAIENDNL